MTTDSYRDFAAAIVQKLVREISGSPLALLPREGPPDRRLDALRKAGLPK